MELIPEVKVSERLGIPRLKLVALRSKHLKRGKDWRRSKAQGRKILWTAGGLERFCAILGLVTPHIVCEEGAEKQGASSGGPSDPLNQPNGMAKDATGSTPAAPVLLTVTKLPMNPYVLNATDAEGKTYLVRVPSNLVYAIGNRLRALPDGTTIGLYRVISQPPRFRGDSYHDVQFR